MQRPKNNADISHTVEWQDQTNVFNREDNRIRIIFHEINLSIEWIYTILSSQGLVALFTIYDPQNDIKFKSFKFTEIQNLHSIVNSLQINKININKKLTKHNEWYTDLPEYLHPKPIKKKKHENNIFSQQRTIINAIYYSSDEAKQAINNLNRSNIDTIWTCVQLISSKNINKLRDKIKCPLDVNSISFQNLLETMDCNTQDIDTMEQLKKYLKTPISINQGTHFCNYFLGYDSWSTSITSLIPVSIVCII